MHFFTHFFQLTHTHKRTHIQYTHNQLIHGIKWGGVAFTKPKEKEKGFPRHQLTNTSRSPLPPPLRLSPPLILRARTLPLAGTSHYTQSFPQTRISWIFKILVLVAFEISCNKELIKFPTEKFTFSDSSMNLKHL